MLSKQILTPEHFHLKRPISENSWNYIRDVSNLQQLLGLHEARGGFIAKLIKEIPKKVLHIFITAMTSSLGYIKIEQEDWGVSVWSPRVQKRV